MAERKWTDAQRDAIEARRGALLVAAAAGSGKTAVLVERAIGRLTDPEHPADADRLLIVTFTKAAAAEMRGRLEKELAARLRQNPGDPLLRRQCLLLPQAHIGTVDSFCSEMVREFFHLLDVAPDFRILSDRQEEEMQARALEQAVSAAFESGEAAGLADAFAGERDDRRMGAMVLELYRFMQSHPFPRQWLADKVDLYFKGDPAPWEDVLLRYAAETAGHCAALCASAMRKIEDGGALRTAFFDSLAAEGEQFSAIERAARAGGWDETAELIRGCAQPGRGRVSAADKDGLYDRLETLRRETKKAREELSGLFARSREQCRSELRAAAPLMESLMELTLSFSRQYDGAKRAGNYLDYSDLEHFAVRLFLTPAGERTDAAREVGARFDEIMIDEFQDINEVQNSIFRAVSRNSENLFMVGDVKQSIYGFRQAMPEIFLRCRRDYEKYDRAKDRYPASVVLDRNFRSRAEVTDAVNFVFSRLMSREAGDIDYTGEERLVCGAEYPEKPGCETELCFLSRPSGLPAEAAEPRWIGERIRAMLQAGFTVTENGKERPAEYGDFCILLRSANRYAHTYARVLQEMGIPAAAAASGGFFAAAEIGFVLSLLQVIDNPNQDIPLLAVLMSPLYGFSPDDCARLRVGAQSRSMALYPALSAAAREDDRCARVVNDLARFRDLAATMSADAFLTLLYENTGCRDMVLAMENGEDRVRNLQLLQRYAREYESAESHGISGFVGFLDRLRRSEGDLQPAESLSDRRGAVAIMSIHRAKGLEFPVCIVAGCGRNFVSDSRSDVLLHPELGLGVRLRDPLTRARVSTAAREAIALESARASAAEELRVLYVAMTRAKEKLILLASDEHVDRMAEWAGAALTEAGASPYSVRKARSAARWLMLCGLCHPDGGELRRLAGCGEEIVSREETAHWRIVLEEAAVNGEAPAPAAEEEPVPADEALLARLREAAAFVYPRQEALGIPAKVAASRLAEERGANREGSLSRPAWMGRKGMTPAERGTALHDFMQFADFAAVAAEGAEKELERLVRRGFLSPEQVAAVEPRRVSAFVEGPVGRRVLAADRVEREKRFAVMIPAALADPERSSAPDETVILQGAVDCLFYEGGKVHIIDFKTDRVDDCETLWERYEPQLRLYAAAMEVVCGLPVGDLILYSTRLNEASIRKNTGKYGEKP